MLGSYLLINANPESPDFKKIAILIWDNHGREDIRYIYDNDDMIITI